MSEKCCVTSKTRSDFIYEHLKEDIVNLYYKPGERLSESKIAERYGVSRDSTRKGITRLVQEGLLISRPQYGTIVCEISAKQGKDVCDIRLLLETYAIRLAVGKLEASITAELMEEHERLWKNLTMMDQKRCARSTTLTQRCTAPSIARAATLWCRRS